MFSLRYPNLLHSIRLLLLPEGGSFPTTSALQLARTLQHTRSGLLLQPHYILCVSVALYCGCSSAKPAESGSEEEKEMLFQLVRVCSLTIGQELSLFLDLLSQAVPPVVVKQVDTDGTNRSPPQRDARLKIAPQLQLLADCTAWISRRELGAADERLQQLLREFCSDCLSTATKITASTPAAVAVAVATTTTTTTDASGTESRAEGGRDDSLAADDDGEREEDVFDLVDAAIQNLRKKLKGLQYFLDANVSSNKID